MMRLINDQLVLLYHMQCCIGTCTDPPMLRQMRRVVMLRYVAMYHTFICAVHATAWIGYRPLLRQRFASVRLCKAFWQPGCTHCSALSNCTSCQCHAWHALQHSLHGLPCNVHVSSLAEGQAWRVHPALTPHRKSTHVTICVHASYCACQGAGARMRTLADCPL
jgi:hypothetical protein